ncbi:TPR domain protein [Aspergillus clavatus NRRL 1]|uniref:TPR domain protein n=1 Tax=Aspergillus clavatus (strain ATCC 1007 / CBS 513.65 / DSM 816 / NCTC 3887 / NRRL 1 / QM 1276 / 107) TaxID=344612 RepID=A1CIN7_ASPCL|nr:TPR domain protein [Aspergillus clavatus NRRL 1]EAW10742.1 TPR domain protein [Aspergillus clavatus NRRL 1]
MLNTASRRACASIPRPKNLQCHQTFSTRSTSHRFRPLNSTGTFPPNRHPQNPLRLSGHGRPQTRHVSFAHRMKHGYQEASKGIWRKNPILLPLAIISVVGASAIFAYISYVEVTRVGPQYHKFPPPVAEALRTAVYYTEIDLNPPKALKAYKEALRNAVELGMHPFSDEMIGIHLQVAMMLEKAGLAKPAIQVLERSKTECLKWVEEGRMRTQDAQKAETEADKKPEKIQIDDSEVLATDEKMKELAEYEERQRDKVLKKVVGINMRLAELYASDYIQDEKKAEACQEAAVELSLKELHRRQALGLPVGTASTGDDRSAWLSLTEMASSLSELAHTYLQQGKNELALPLLLRALDMLRTDEGKNPTCKQVTLMADVATAITGELHKNTPSPGSAAAPQQLIDSGKQWAQKALDVAARLQPPVRDEECDMSCVAAMHSLGEIAHLQGKRKEAEKYWLEARSLAKGLGFDEGVVLVDEALAQLKK